MSEKYFGYLAVVPASAPGQVPSKIRLGTTLDAAKASLEVPDEQIIAASGKQPPSIKHSDLPLKATMLRFVDVSRSQSELISMMELIGPAYTAITLNKEVLDPIRKPERLVEKLPNAAIYGLSKEDFRALIPSLTARDLAPTAAFRCS